MTPKEKALACATIFAALFCLKSFALDAFAAPSTLKSDITALVTGAKHIRERTRELGQVPSTMDDAQIRNKIGDNPLDYMALNDEFILTLKRIDDTITINQDYSLYTTHPFRFFDGHFWRDLMFYSEWIGYKFPWLGGFMWVLYSVGLWYFAPRYRFKKPKPKEAA